MLVRPISSCPKLSVPIYDWTQLSEDDRFEFCNLCSAFARDRMAPSLEGSCVAFPSELVRLLQYVDRCATNVESRAICAGILFLGPLICVNTRQLKAVMRRCKSSINSLLQRLGYFALRTHATTRLCLTKGLPTLAQDPGHLRQWTVRQASSASGLCFVARFAPSPALMIAEDNEPMAYVPKLPSNHLVIQFASLASVPPTAAAK
jgi:hypothetical protein